MSKPTNKHPLIYDTPSDTLHNCAEVIAYLKRQDIVEPESEETEAERNGRFCILRCVETALLYEAARSDGVIPDKLQAVS